MPTVETTTGRLEGLEKDGIAVFRGVPFAAPPVGERRFRPPAPVEPWTGVRPAAQWGPPAPQSSGLGTLGTFDYSGWSEDCLSLNVWTPACDGARRPVMVWVHGGAFVSGSGATPIYSGSRLARRGDVVVVTLNYRLGPFGFLGHPDLVDEATGSTGNWALLDLVAGLEWVRDNVGAFGGDPGNVTVFGESAGSMCALTLLASPLAAGLFHKVVGQSGVPVSGTVDEAAEVAERLAAAAGLASVGGLRDLDARAVLEAQEASSLSLLAAVALAFKPTVDGHVLAAPPFETVAAGEPDVPLVLGTTRHEMRLFLMPFVQATTVDDAFVRDRLAETVGEGSGDLLARYEAWRADRGEPVGPPDLWAAVETDRFFRVPATVLAERRAARGGRAWMYLFTHESPALGGLLGSCHALDVPFVFGTHDLAGAGQFCGEGPEVDALAADMQDAWLAFARTGSPSTEGLDWPRYGGESRSTMVFATEGRRVVEDPAGAERALWVERTGGDVAPRSPGRDALDRIAGVLG